MSTVGKFSPLIVEDLGTGRDWELEVPLTYTAEDGTVYMVPAGFVTDFYSTPPMTRNLFPKSMKGNAASVVHDAAYRGVLSPAVDRKRADALLREGMKALGVGKVRRFIIWAAVRVGGKGKYNGT